MAWSRVYGALMRHMWLWFYGQDKDVETRLSHLSNASCCLMFLQAWELRGVGEDDRPKLPESVLAQMSNTDFMESAMQVLAELAEKQKEKDALNGHVDS